MTKRHICELQTVSLTESKLAESLFGQFNKKVNRKLFGYQTENNT